MSPQGRGAGGGRQKEKRKGTNPDGQPSITQWLASLDVNDTNVEVEVNTLLVLTDIVTVEFTINTVRAEDGIHRKNAGVVLDGGEDVPVLQGGGLNTGVGAALVELLAAALHVNFTAGRKLCRALVSGADAMLLRGVLLMSAPLMLFGVR